MKTQTPGLHFVTIRESWGNPHTEAFSNTVFPCAYEKYQKRYILNVRYEQVYKYKWQALASGYADKLYF